MKMRSMKTILAALLCCLVMSGCGSVSEESGQVAYVDDLWKPIATEESLSEGQTVETTASMEATSEEVEGESAEESTEKSAEESVPEVAPVEPEEISLIMVGDVLLHTPVAKSGKLEDGTYDFSAVFAHVKDTVKEADLALVNQEVIIGGSELGISGYPAFNAPYELGNNLMETGFDVILHATNHALDKGKTGLLNCLNFWKENYPETAVLGIADSEEQSEAIYVYEQDGMKIAILNFTYGTNGISLPSNMPYAVSLLEESKVTAALQKANELADFVIVAPHWGTEYTLEQTSYQKKWAKLFAQNGVDLVIGTHPHVIEPVVWWGQDESGSWSEVKSEPETGEKMLVYYSLGNFVNWTSGTGAGVANRMVGGMARVTLAKNEDGQVEIARYGVTPLVSHVESGFGGVTVYPLNEYTAELGQQSEIRGQDSTFSYEYCVNLAEKVFGDAVVY